MDHRPLLDVDPEPPMAIPVFVRIGDAADRLLGAVEGPWEDARGEIARLLRELADAVEVS